MQCLIPDWNNYVTIAGYLRYVPERAFASSSFFRNNPKSIIGVVRDIGISISFQMVISTESYTMMLHYLLSKYIGPHWVRILLYTFLPLLKHFCKSLSIRLCRSFAVFTCTPSSIEKLVTFIANLICGNRKSRTVLNQGDMEDVQGLWCFYWPKIGWLIMHCGQAPSSGTRHTRPFTTLDASF